MMGPLLLLALLAVPGSAELRHRPHTRTPATLECDACVALVTKAGAAARANDTQWFLDGMEILCPLLLDFARQPEVDAVECRGLVLAWGAELFAAASSGLALNERLLCWGFIHACPKPADAPSWTATFPTPAPRYVPPAPAGPNTLRVMQLSDVHIDPAYAVGSPAQCGQSICCHSSSPRTGNATARQWGEYNCDLPTTTWEQFLVQAQPASMVLLTGDMPSHTIWNQSAASNTVASVVVAQQLRAAWPNATVIPTIGNHEAWPCNNFAAPPYNLPLYSALAQAWEPWIGASAAASLRQAGYFAYQVRTKGKWRLCPPLLTRVQKASPTLRVLSVQTNYCNNGALWLYLNDSDPGQQLHWLIAQLQDAEDAGTFAWLIGHIPPSNGACRQEWADNFARIVSRYANTVRGLFFGHTHSDSFAVGHTPDSQTPNTLQFVAPSLTPYHNRNPSWRYYTIDAATSVPVDYDQWQFDLSATYASRSAAPVARLFYRARQRYALDALLPADWAGLIARMQTNDTLFTLFWRAFNADCPLAKPCTGHCKAARLCTLSHATVEACPGAAALESVC